MKNITFITLLFLLFNGFCQSSGGKDTTTSTGEISWNVGSSITIYSDANPSLEHILTVETIITSLEDDNPINIISVFPNPTSSIIEIVTEQKIQFNLIDINGQVVLQGENKLVDLTHLYSGTYILNLLSEQKQYKYNIIKL